MDSILSPPLRGQRMGAAQGGAQDRLGAEAEGNSIRAGRAGVVRATDAIHVTEVVRSVSGTEPPDVSGAV